MYLSERTNLRARVRHLAVAAAIFVLSCFTGVALSEGFAAIRDANEPNEKCRSQRRSATDVGNANGLIPDGIYVPTTLLPQTFLDLTYLEIITREQKEGNGNITVPPYSSLVTGNGRRLAKIQIRAADILFQTETIGGVSYSFVGRFRNVDEYNPELQIGSLTGKLTKLQDEIPVGETDLDFYGPRARFTP